MIFTIKNKAYFQTKETLQLDKEIGNIYEKIKERTIYFIYFRETPIMTRRKFTYFQIKIFIIYIISKIKRKILNVAFGPMYDLLENWMLMLHL